jgi:methylenetetrahydrofolate dehydrogenase (NADP+) / methenyltetrahydrofolate cyclohydrolase
MIELEEKIIDGNKVKKAVLEQLGSEISILNSNTGKSPGLAVILVGNNPASKAYVGMKKKACDQIGIKSFEYLMNPEEGQLSLEKLIDSLNKNADVHGILLQLPLPKGFDEQRMLSLISPEKDVDGFHPVNVGRLLLGLPTFNSCTPYGICELLERYDIDPTGKHVVIVGRSNIVGKPLAAMLMQKGPFRNATVTVCHSRSEDIETICRSADILVAAVGIPYYIKENMVSENTIVIDVGINRVDAPELEKGYKLVGDVDYINVFDTVKAITPVPGGVGPLTIAMLMKNTLQAFRTLETNSNEN